jgi:hypothetical protein
MRHRVRNITALLIAALFGAAFAADENPAGAKPESNRIERAAKKAAKGADKAAKRTGEWANRTGNRVGKAVERTVDKTGNWIKKKTE